VQRSDLAASFYRFVATIFVKEMGVVNTCANIWLDAAKLGKMVLQRKRWWQQPRIASINTAASCYVMRRYSCDQFRCDIRCEEIGNIKFRHEAVVNAYGISIRNTPAFIGQHTYSTRTQQHIAGFKIIFCPCW
jgi:hypothetical protein